MKFISRSLLILLALYGLVFAIGDLYLVRGAAPLWLALVWAVAIIAIQFLISPSIIQWVFDIWWDESLVASKLPQETRDFLTRICAERHVPMPRLGVIPSGTPNAFSFGHVPSDSRIVVTTGLIEILTPQELQAVLAHELGHIEHWDFAIMGVAALAPLLLYQLYVFTRNVNNARLVAYAAYLCYLLSQFIVLLLNRTREYFADHYAACVTHTPDALSSALVKIAYGMVKSEGDFRQLLEQESGKEKQRMLRAHGASGALALMGISNVNSGAALVLGGADPTQAAAVMRWDLVNPWARLYELNSTHPLTALRVRALNREATEQHQMPHYQLPSDQRIRWGAFPFEVILWAAPFVSGAVIFSVLFLGRAIHLDFASNQLLPELLMFSGATWIVRTWYRYHGEFAPAQIGRLLEDEDVSQMQPRAVKLAGEILGRGVPGTFWSPDLVMRDTSGIIFVLYRQSIPFARLLFALKSADELAGQKVVIEGWFRRGLRPYVEMSRLTTEDGRTHRAYSRWVQYVLSVGAIAAGWLWYTATTFGS
jgi:heat shock protein HtpX